MDSKQSSRWSNPNAATASHEAAWKFLKAVSPRRRWWLWVAAALAYWSLAGSLLPNLQKVTEVHELRCVSPWARVIALLPQLLLMLLGILAAVTAPAKLFADLNSGSLETILLTTVERKDILDKYHLRNFATLAIITVVTVLPFLPLYIWQGRNAKPSEGLGEAIGHWIALLGIGTATVYLAALAGLSLAVLSGSRVWGTILALVLTAAFILGFIELSMLISDLLAGIVYVAIYWFAAILLGELLLSFAARRLDRLVTD